MKPVNLGATIGDVSQRQYKRVASAVGEGSIGVAFVWQVLKEL